MIYIVKTSSVPIKAGSRFFGSHATIVSSQGTSGGGGGAAYGRSYSQDSLGTAGGTTDNYIWKYTANSEGDSFFRGDELLYANVFVTTYGGDVAKTTGPQNYQSYAPIYSTSNDTRFLIPDVTTRSVNGRWSTSTTEVSYNYMRREFESYSIVDLTRIEVIYGPETFTVGYEEYAHTVSAFAEPHEIGVYFSAPNIPFTKGETFLKSTSFSYDLKTRYQWVEELDTEFGYVPTFGCRCPYSMGTSNKQYGGAYHYFSRDTLAVPKRWWHDGDETTEAIVTLLHVKTTSIADTYPDSNNSSSSSSTSVAYGSLVTWFYTVSDTMLCVYDVAVPLETTVPVFGGGGYLIATAKSGWCVPNSGFHTVEPNSTISPTLSEGGAVAIGSARPGVSLYTPIGAVKPNYPTTTATYIVGRGISKTEKATSAVAGYTPDSYAFTFEQNGSIAISPNVVVVTRAGASAASSLTLSVIEAASEYASTGDCAGGYKDLSLTWTFVALEAGLLIAFIDDTSSTSFFSSPTTSAFSGSKASSFSFLPCIANSLYERLEYLYHYGRIATLPVYNHDEF
jgi:hypothetical protein